MTTATQIKERPILMSASMVVAILEGRKTQTRRLVNFGKFDPDYGDPSPDNPWAVFPPWECGNHLWVRETFGLWAHSFESVGVYYAAGGEDKIVDFPNKNGMPSLEVQCQRNIGGGRRNRPSIFMPRWASRITLEVLSVRVERLRDISEDDAIAEGINCAEPFKAPYRGQFMATAQLRYAFLWDSINGKKYPWDSNPWIWCISFRKLP